MTAATQQQVAEFGQSVVDRIVDELAAVPADGYAHMDEIKNLAGDVTGFTRVYTADRITKITHLSIDIMPGARYFNIMVAPDTRYDIPRFANEGMISTHGSQVSTDMYHDIDLQAHIREFVARTQGVTDIFQEAKASDIAFVPSRQVHMRAFCSPHFLNVFNASGEELPRLEKYAHRYFGEWKKFYDAAAEVGAAEAADRLRRRRHMSDIVIELDPDRNMVVQVFGEDTVCAIEQAVMY